MILNEFASNIVLETVSETTPSQWRREPTLKNRGCTIEPSGQYIQSMRRITDCFVSFPKSPDPSIMYCSPFRFYRKQGGEMVEVESIVRRYTSYCRHYVSIAYKEVPPNMKNSSTKYDTEVAFSKLKTGLSLLFLPYSLDVPEQFLSSGLPKSKFGLRLEPGVLALSIDGPFACRTDYLIGIAGMGWFEPKTYAHLHKIRPGKLLSLAGLSRRNGKLPDKWTDRDRNLSSMKLLEGEGRGE